MDDDRAEAVQSAIVRAGRTADTIQSVHDVVENRANQILEQTKDEENIISKINSDCENLIQLLNLVCRGVKGNGDLKLF